MERASPEAPYGRGVQAGSEPERGGQRHGQRRPDARDHRYCATERRRVRPLVGATGAAVGMRVSPTRDPDRAAGPSSPPRMTAWRVPWRRSGRDDRPADKDCRCDAMVGGAPVSVTARATRIRFRCHAWRRKVATEPARRRGAGVAAVGMTGRPANHRVAAQHRPVPPPRMTWQLRRHCQRDFGRRCPPARLPGFAFGIGNASAVTRNSADIISRSSRYSSTTKYGFAPG